MSSHFALKNHFHEGRIVNDRLIFSTLFAGLLFIALIARLIVLQVVEFEHFDALSEKNRVDISSIVPQRGLIYDRNGVMLAENIPTFSLELTPENVPDIDDTLQQLAALFAMTEEDMLDIKGRIKQQRRFRQVILKERLTELEVAIFSVNRHRFSGVDVVGRLIRHYPQGALFAHTVGYVGRISEQDLQEIDQQNYKGSMQIGKTGIEKQYEQLLHGQVGYQQVETNVQGRIVRQLDSMPAVSGQDLFLHLDINLQRVAAESMGDFNGAVVALDPKTGGVLAMVSKPDFDPNEFVLGISNKSYAALRDSPDMPLFNRSLRGRYPPGSTLKPFIALAGLEYGIINERSKTFCPGWYTLPGQEHRYRCWKKHGHGHMDLENSISQSCDVYYYDLANTLGIDRIHSFLDLFRFGRRTEIDLPGESKGLSPSKEWKRANRNKVWYPGETLISGIGQGFNQMTPIQIAHATAVLAMRGIDVSPRVVRASRATGQSELQLFPAQTYETLPMENSRNWEAVIDSMVDVVHGSRGSARHIGQDLPFNIAGKTGTSQVFGIKQNEKYDAKTLERKLHDHALFIAFAPAENPLFVVAVVVEHGGGGGTTAAPIARKMIDQYFGTAVNE